jgi:hypothetical protein
MNELTKMINWESVLTGSLTFIIILAIKLILDFKIAHWWIKYLWWIPLRNYFRTKPISISGYWEESWELQSSERFKEDTKRHSHPRIKQQGKYCYAEFIADGRTYGVFGTIMNEYFIGEWYDVNDPIGYFGTFHLQVEDSSNMSGKWLGHSKSFHGVRQGEWKWKKINK